MATADPTAEPARDARALADARRGAAEPAAARAARSLHFALPQPEARLRALRRARSSSCSRSSGRGSPTPTRSSSATRSARRRRATTGSARRPPGQDVFAQFVYGLRASFSSARSAAAVAGDDRHDGRLRRRLPRRRRRRGAQHAHERRPRHPDARGADHRRRLPQRRQPRRRGHLHRPHLVAVGRAGDPRADVLARLPRLRQPRAALGRGARSGHRPRRSRRT